MKRAGKCAGKKAFAYIYQAEAQVIKNHVLKRKTFGIYECPTCLDFHLTSLYDNRTPEIKKKCIKLAKAYWTCEPSKRFAVLNKKVLSHANPKIKKVKQPPPPPNPNSQSAIRKKKKREYKASIVSNAIVKQKLAELDRKKLSTPKSFWCRVLGIIKGVGN